MGCPNSTLRLVSSQTVQNSAVCELNFVKYDNKLQRNTSTAADYPSPKSDAPSASDPLSTNDPPTVQPVTPVVSPEPTSWVIFCCSLVLNTLFIYFFLTRFSLISPWLQMVNQLQLPILFFFKVISLLGRKSIRFFFFFFF